MTKCIKYDILPEIEAGRIVWPQQEGKAGMERKKRPYKNKKAGAKKPDRNRFVIVTGLSGAGKSLAIKHFEDLGFFCVDNLPTLLIPKFAQLMKRGGGKDGVGRIALMVDIRERGFFDKLFIGLESLDKMRIKYEILFLEASDDVLLRRYKETRRPHPLRYGTVLEDIHSERRKMEEVRGRADIIIDTSSITPQEFKSVLIKNYLSVADTGMSIGVISFGYKYGIPADADLVFDVRFLPNPHYVESLKPLTGKGKEVRGYVMKWPIARQFLERLVSFLEFLIPRYMKEGKAYLTIAVGCTGGRHRSVVIAEQIKKRLVHIGREIKIAHRDIGKQIKN